MRSYDNKVCLAEKAFWDGEMGTRGWGNDLDRVVLKASGRGLIVRGILPEGCRGVMTDFVMI